MLSDQCIEGFHHECNDVSCSCGCHSDDEPTQKDGDTVKSQRIAGHGDGDQADKE